MTQSLKDIAAGRYSGIINTNTELCSFKFNKKY